MNFFRTHILKIVSLSLLLISFVSQSIPMLENEHQNQRFTQWLNKHFDHSLAANQYPELQDPEYLKSIRLHLEKLWKESNNVEQRTYAVKAYLKQKNLDKKLLIQWNILDHMDQHQHVTLMLEPRVCTHKNHTQGKFAKLTTPNYLVQFTNCETQIISHFTLHYPSYSASMQKHPMINGIAIGAP